MKLSELSDKIDSLRTAVGIDPEVVFICNNGTPTRVEFESVRYAETGSIHFLIKDSSATTYLRVPRRPCSATEMFAVAKELESSGKIAAIKELRTLTGFSLKDAKDVVDEFIIEREKAKRTKTEGESPLEFVAAVTHKGTNVRGCIVKFPRDLTKVEEDKLKANLTKGHTHKIPAIKDLRESTGWGLKESKDCCDCYCNNPHFIMGAVVAYLKEAISAEKYTIDFVVYEAAKAFGSLEGFLHYITPHERNNVSVIHDRMFEIAYEVQESMVK